MNKTIPGLVCMMVLAVSGCSRQQSDWEKARAANTTDSYELFLKKYPSGEFTAQAQARVKELYEERDWQKARDADTPDAYQAFLKQYPEGKWTEEARIRVENFSLAQAPGAPAGAETAGVPPASAPPAGPAPVPAAKPPTKAAVPAPAVASGTTMGTGPGAKSAPKAPAKAAKPEKPPGGDYGVQLGAFGAGADAAHKRWSELQAAYPTVLTGLTPKVSPAKGSTGTLYRLQVFNLPEKRAHALCAALKAKKQACVLIIPPHPARSK
jgi:cell division protein FtsN